MMQCKIIVNMNGSNTEFTVPVHKTTQFTFAKLTFPQIVQ